MSRNTDRKTTLPYHDPREQSLRVPLFYSQSYFNAVEKFLRIIEELPETHSVIEDLEQNVPLYTPAISSCIENGVPLLIEELRSEMHGLPSVTSIDELRDLPLISPAFTSVDREIVQSLARGWKYSAVCAWDIIKDSPNEECQMFCRELQSWASKHNFIHQNTSSPLYIEIALRAVALHVDNNMPLSLCSPLKMTILHSDHFNQINPFVFAPSRTAISTMSEHISDYNELWHREMLQLQERASQAIRALAVGHNVEVDLDSFSDAHPTPPWLGYGWDIRTSWEQFETELDAAYRRYKLAYKKACQDYGESEGFHPIPPEKTAEHHYEWLARYQIQGLTYGDLAFEYDEDADYIGKKVRETAKYLFLTLRPGNKGGRPTRK